MKEYTFEYTRQGFTYFLFVSSIAILALEIFLLRTFFKNLTVPGVAIIVIIAIAVAFFLLNKHKIKRIGTATLSSTDVSISLNVITHIAFSDLKYYYPYGGKNGITFRLGFIDGTKFEIGANNNFCNDDLLQAFLFDLQSSIETYKAQNKVNIIHLETVFARKQAPYILTALTILIILGFCFTKMPLTILSIGLSAGVSVGWIRYFQQRSQNKLVDF